MELLMELLTEFYDRCKRHKLYSGFNWTNADLFRIRSAFCWMIAAGILITLAVWLCLWGIHVSQDWATLQQNPTDATKKKFDASLDIAKAIVSGISTIATIGGGFFVLWNIRLTQTRLITERFSKAVEQLGSDKIEVRLGGIYALERIAYDSNRDHWTIMEVLTSFIQEKSPIKPILEGEISAKAYEIWQKDGAGNTDEENWDRAIRYLTAARVTKDIQAALRVIQRRHRKDPPDKGLDIYGANLSHTNLIRADLFRVNFNNTNLSSAYLFRAYLSEAYFFRTNLTNANLIEANLYRANLTEANLIGANLYRAEIWDANLSRANLANAQLSKTNLSGANLSGANLSGANLSGANLSRVKNWSDDQLSQAKLCRTTLPDGSMLDPERDCEELMFG